MSMGGGIRKISVSFPQFCYKLKTALKKISFLKIRCHKDDAFSINLYRSQCPLITLLSKHKSSSSVMFIQPAYSLSTEAMFSTNCAGCFQWHQEEINPDPFFPSVYTPVKDIM